MRSNGLHRDQIEGLAGKQPTRSRDNGLTLGAVFGPTGAMSEQ